MPHPENPDAVCIFCGNTRNSFKYPTHDMLENDYELRQCLECGCWFLFPMPTDEILSKAYDTSYYGAEQHKFGVKPVAKFIDNFRGKRAAGIARLLKENQCALDIGCGRGDFLRHLSSYGNFNLYGIERSETALVKSGENNNIHILSRALSETDFPDDFFDVVTMFHVFEHLTEPKKTLEIISSILKPGGHLVISIPNIGSWQARWFKGKWLHLDPPRHLLFFEPRDFFEVMKKLNFSIEKVNYYSLEQNPYGWFQSLMNVFTQKREVLFERLKGNKVYAPEYGKLNILFQKFILVLTLPFFVFLSLFESFFGKGGTVKFVFKNSKP